MVASQGKAKDLPTARVSTSASVLELQQLQLQVAALAKQVLAASGEMEKLRQKMTVADASVMNVLKSAYDQKATVAVSAAAVAQAQKQAEGETGDAYYDGGSGAGSKAGRPSVAEVLFGAWQGRLLLLCSVWSAALSVLLLARSWDSASAKQLKAAAAAAHVHMQ